MEKTREQISEERKARKAVKLLRKKKSQANAIENESSQTNTNSEQQICLENLAKQIEKKVVDMEINNIDTILNKMSIENPKISENQKTLIENTKVLLESSKSKASIRAEGRVIQEAQRVHKAALKKKIIEERAVIKSSPKTKTEPKEITEKNKLAKNVNIHKIKLFSHLYRNASIEESKILANSSSQIHRAVIKLGLQYKNKIIIGSNSRVVALLNTLKQVLVDYQTPTEKDFSRGFEIVLSDTITYLQNCRPISVSMTNAVKYLKWHLSQLPNNITDSQAKIKLREAIDDYVKEQIDMAGKAICIMVQRKISQGDVILTFGYSSLIQRILIETFQVGIKFRVIIVDAGPLYEGKELLKRLVKHGLNCTYVLLSATSYIMKEANKVLLGAHALLTNGYVMSRAGSSQVALVAKSYNVPVLVCCETYKFSERVQTDAFVYNELGNSEELIKNENWKSNNYLTPLTLMYDVTPSDLITAVVTELAVLPCTSVPVVLRVKPTSSTLS